MTPVGQEFQADETNVMDLAGRWSVDPSRLEERGEMHAPGWLADAGSLSPAVPGAPAP